MNTMIKSGICLACILAALALHFLMPGDLTYWLGIALIFIPVWCLAPKTPKSRAFDDYAADKRWCDIEPEDVNSTFVKLQGTNKGTNFGSGVEKAYYTGCLNIVVMGIAGFISFGLWGSDETVLAALAIDIFAVPWALMHLKYGSDPDSAFSFKPTDCVGDIEKKLPNLKLIYSTLEQHNNYIKPTLQLEVSHGNFNQITDIRIGLNAADERIEGMLCSMVSVSQNKVQDKVYPYSYFVVVFKGEKIYSSNQVHDDLLSLQSRCFSPELNLNDGNTVLVITKKSGYPEYATDNNDCQELVDVIFQCFNWMMMNRDTIKKLTK